LQVREMRSREETFSLAYDGDGLKSDLLHTELAEQLDEAGIVPQEVEDDVVP
jgi:hypothetical protein